MGAGGDDVCRRMGHRGFRPSSTAQRRSMNSEPAGRRRLRGITRGWLSTVARRIVIDRWRSASRRREVLTDPAPGVTVEDVTQQTADRQLVLAALRTLSIEH